MATEEEAREAADGKEVQEDNVVLEPVYMQTQLDRKLSSVEIKNIREIVDSTEGTLKIPEGQVLVEAPSQIKLPPEHNLNGTTPFLNGHMDEEENISNEQLHEDNKRDHEQVEAAFDGASTDQSNKIKKEEVNDCSSHGEITTEDSSLLKHEKEEEPKGDDQQDENPVQEDTVKTDNVGCQLDQNLDPAKATEDTQLGSMANIPDVEVVTEARAGVQTLVDPNLDDSDAIPDTIDGNTETDEPAKEDTAVNLDHRESFPEDTSIAEHTEEVVEDEHQWSKQADAMNANVVQEEIPKCEETGMQEEMPKSEHADESIVGAQEVLNQEPYEETDNPVYEIIEQTSHQSSMAASDDPTLEHDATTSEPAVNIQVRSQESLEEMENAEAVDTDSALALQQSSAAVEAVPEDHAAAIEQDSVETNNTETAETHNVRTVSTSEEDKVEDDVTAEGPTRGSQEVDNAGSSEEITKNIAKNMVEVSNVATVDEADKENNVPRSEDIAEKHMRGIEPEETTNTKPVETEEDSDRRHVSLLDASSQEDNTTSSEEQQMESASEIKEIETTKTEAAPQESNASVSEEPSPKDYIAESETTCQTQEVNITESLEVIEGDKETKSREISDQSNMDSAGETIQENNIPESEPTSDIQPEQESSEEMKDTEPVQVNEPSHETNATVFHKPTQENNPTARDLHVMESAGSVSNFEASKVQVSSHQINGDQPEEQATEENVTSSEPQTLEQESVERINDIEATEPQSISHQSIISPSEESISEEIAKEDNVTIQPDDGHQQPQNKKSEELDETGASIVSKSEETTLEDNVTVTEPGPDTQAENSQTAEEIEDTENVKSHGALADEVSQEENVETEGTVDISPAQEPQLEEAKNTEPVRTEDNMTPSDLPVERMDMETVDTEAIPQENPVASTTEMTEADILTAIAPHSDIQPVLEQGSKSIEDMISNTTKQLGETQQVVAPACGELTPTEQNAAVTEPACDTQLQNVTAQEIKDSEDAKTDQLSNLPTTLGEVVQESKLPRIEPTSDVQEVQELCSTEETKGNEAVETEDHQEHRVSTVEEPAVDNEPNVDDKHVHADKPAELKDSEAMEVEEVLAQSSTTTPDNAPEEKSEPGNGPDFYVQPAQQIESSRDSEGSQLLKAEDTSDQKVVTLDETDPPVDIEQEHELESVEDIKDISVNEAEEDFHTRQPDASDKLASESNIATIEPTYDIQQQNDYGTEEMKGIEAIDDGDISCEQTEIATSEDPSPTDNEIAPEEHPAKSHEENVVNDFEKASEEQKDDAFNLGETVSTTEKSKNATNQGAVSGEDILETSDSIDQTKEEQKAGIEHNSSQMSSEHHGENIAHVQDKDIHGGLVTERGTAETSKDLIENDAQASQTVTEKDDTIQSGEQTSDSRKSGDVELRLQTCESSVEDEAVNEVSLDEQHKQDEEVESQKKQPQADEQEYEDKRDDVVMKPLVNSQNIENGTTNRTEETDILEGEKTEAVVTESLKNEQALHTSEESVPSIADTKVEDIMGTDEGSEEEIGPNSASTLETDAKVDNEEEHENTEKDNMVALDSADEHDEKPDEITNEELEAGLASSVQEISHPADEHTLENDQIAVPQNVESGEHGEDKECINITTTMTAANLHDSDAIPDAIDGKTETEEPAKEDSAVNLDHRESFPEDTYIAKHTEDVVKDDDEQSKQADAMNANGVQDEIPKCEETGVQEEMPKSEHADESTVDAQEELNQEPSEETNDPVNKITEQTSHQSSMAASDDPTLEHDATTSEPAVNIQVRSQVSLEEMENTEAVDTESALALQQSSAAFDEAVPEDFVAGTEQESVETKNTENAETHTSVEDEVEDDVTAEGSTSGSQEVDNAGSSEETAKNIDEHIVEVSNVATVDEADKENNVPRSKDIAEKHMRGIEPEETTNAEPVETEEDSDQRHVSLLDASAQEDNTPASEEQQMESASEINEIETTKTEAVPQESDARVSEEPSPKDDITESEKTCETQEVSITESLEAIQGDNDTKTREISDQSNMDSAGGSIQENNVPESEPTSDIQPEQEPESEEMKDTEPVQVNEPSHETNATVFHKLTQENNPIASDLHVMESAGSVSNSQASEVQASSHQINVDQSEEQATEENVTSSEPQTLEPKSVERINDIEATEPQSISQQSIMSPSEESIPEEIAKEDNVTIQSDDGHQQPKNQESEELDETGASQPQEIASSSIVSKSEEPILEDNVTVTEPGPDTRAENLQTAEEIEDTENVKSHGALADEASQEENDENITHVTDKYIHGDLVTERGTTEASQDLIENDSQASQTVTEKDDTRQSGEETSDSRQSGDVELQPQTCESSVEDEAVKEVILDEQYKEYAEVERKKKQPQADEQEYKDKRDDVAMEPLVHSQDIENGTTNRTEETDIFEAEKTEAVVTESLKNKQALHTSEESIPSITDTKVEDIMGTDDGAEEENGPNSASTLEADVKVDNKEEHKNTEKDNMVAMDSADEHDEKTDEITNEELEAGLASSVQEISLPADEYTLENDPIAVPHNVESGEHGEDKECINKVNDDVLAIQEPEKEIVPEVKETKEIQTEDKAVHHAESETKAEEEETSQLYSNEPNTVDTKMDDTTHSVGIIHDNTTIQPREIEKIGENKGLGFISTPAVETYNVEQDLSIHHKVQDEMLESAEDNAVEVEAMQQQVDTPNAYKANDDQLATSSSLNKHETESADDVLQLETEENASSKIDEAVLNEKTEDTETATFKASDDTRRNLDVLSVVTASNEESMNKKMEHHKLDLPAHPTQDEKTPEQEMSLAEKPLPTEAEEQEDNQMPKEQHEDEMHEPDFGDDQKEVEQDLPVSHFLMNLILGKENSDANGHAEPEAETKQEETRDDNSYLIISEQEESLASLPTENNMDDKLHVEQEKEDVKCFEETHEVVKEQSHDLKLGTETSLETDAELNKNSHHLDVPPYKDSMQDEISSELLSEEEAEVVIKMEAEDIHISNIEQDDKAVDTISQENMEATTQIENKNFLTNNLDDLTNTKASEEDTLGEGQTELLPECLNDGRSVDAVSEQTVLLTKSGMPDVKSLTSEAGSARIPVCAIQDKTIESSNSGAVSTADIQLDNEQVVKTEEKQPATTATGEVAEEHVEFSNENLQKIIRPEETSDGQEPQITEQVSDTALAHEKEISEGSSSTFMVEKESSNFPVEGVDNLHTAVENQADGSSMKTNQDKQEAADNRTKMEHKKLEESNVQEHQENGTEQKSPKGCDEEDQQLLVKKETVIEQEDVHEPVESHTETVKIKSNEEQEQSYSKVQERDLNVFSPKEAPEAEENFVGIAKPEFSTDEEQSPKADELDMAEQKIYEGKTKDEVGTKNFTDEAMKTEARGGQKAARKKQNLLSGVGSKVKHQLAKVKKAIIGKPGQTKPVSPKS